MGHKHKGVHHKSAMMNIRDDGVQKGKDGHIRIKDSLIGIATPRFTLYSLATPRFTPRLELLAHPRHWSGYESARFTDSPFIDFKGGRTEVTNDKIQYTYTGSYTGGRGLVANHVFKPIKKFPLQSVWFSGLYEGTTIVASFLSKPLPKEEWKNYTIPKNGVCKFETSEDLKNLLIEDNLFKYDQRIKTVKRVLELIENKVKHRLITDVPELKGLKPEDLIVTFLEETVNSKEENDRMMVKHDLAVRGIELEDKDGVLETGSHYTSYSHALHTDYPDYTTGEWKERINDHCASLEIDYGCIQWYGLFNAWFGIEDADHYPILFNHRPVEGIGVPYMSEQGGVPSWRYPTRGSHYGPFEMVYSTDESDIWYLFCSKNTAHMSGLIRKKGVKPKRKSLDIRIAVYTMTITPLLKAYKEKYGCGEPNEAEIAKFKSRVMKKQKLKQEKLLQHEKRRAKVMAK